MADTIKRAVDIEVTIRHADTAKRDLRDVADATDKAAGSAQKLLRELLEMSGGLKSLGAAAADTGAQIVSLENVESMATWFKKATKEVNEFEAATAKTGTTARKTSGDFAKMEAELQRLADVTESGVRISRLLIELRDSAEWLVPAIKKARAAGYEFTGVLYQMANLTERYAKAALGTKDALKELQRETRDLKDTTKDLHKATEQETYDISEFDEVVKGAGKETKKTGGTFDFAHGKLLKFAGAVGLGIYSFYSLASAIRRSLRTIKDWITGGIERAIEENAELSQLIKTQVVGALDRLQLKLGQQVTPGIREMASAVAKLIRTLEETGAIEAFGNLFANMITGAARALTLLAEGADRLKETVEDIKAAIPEAKESWPAKAYRAMPKGLRMAGGALTGIGLGYEVGEYLQAPVPEEEIYWEKGGARQPKKEKPKKGKAPADISFEKFRESRDRLRAAERVRELEEVKAAAVEREMVFPKDEELAARSAGIKKELTETEMGIAAKAEAKRIAKLKKHAEEIGRLMDPTSFLIEGLKSKDMGKAAKDAGIMLGETMARELMRKLIISGVMQILTLITGGAAAPLQLATAQKGMYTGEHEGPVWVHPREVIAPLDTISQMSKLINTAMVGGAPAAAAAPAPGGVNVMVAERAGDLVDVYRTESTTRGGEALSALEGA